MADQVAKVDAVAVADAVVAVAVMEVAAEAEGLGGMQLPAMRNAQD